MKNSMKLIEPLIYEYTTPQNQKVRYRVKSSKCGVVVNNTFDTLEEARNFKMYYIDCISKVRLQKKQSVQEFNSENVHLEYPETLLNEIGILPNDNDNYYDEIIPNFEKNFEKVSEHLNYKEKTFLLDYYKNLKTLDEIGVSYGLTRERVRHVLLRTIRKLKFNKYKEILIQGRDKFDMISMEEKEKIIQEFKDNISLDLYKEWLTKQDSDILKMIADYISLLIKKLRPAQKIGIEELNLSVRTYNCLKRSLINTLEDLYGKSDHQLMSIRNLGRKSYIELKEKLEKFRNGNE